MTIRSIEQDAEALILRVANGCISQFEGTWTLSVYDTAWLAMIKRPDGSWLFPECFNYILDEQQEGSGWANYASDIDGILNTMAALLAIERHICDPILSKEKKDALKTRSQSGVKHLRHKLNNWNVSSCMHVGFEILIPALLRMLKDVGIDLDFKGKAALTALNVQKMKYFKPKILYSLQQTTLLHSVEAFQNRVDFNKMHHHLVNGSMLGSPAATAAYLMGIDEWDTEAEKYLQIVVKHGGGAGSGGVPSAYPCEIFEFSWVSLESSYP